MSEFELKRCIEVMETFAADAKRLAELSEEDRSALLRAAGRLSRPERDEIKRRQKAATQYKRFISERDDRSLRAGTGLREARKVGVFTAPPRLTSSEVKSSEQVLNSPRNCYVCKEKFTRLHHFYDAMCPSCAEFNYQKRFQMARLDGRFAVITGARLKIGFQATLLMLRAGAKVCATTRFPVDAAMRFAQEKDFPEWRNRLQIYGLDLRHTPSVELFARHLEETEPRLDILINNAAQTVRRPPVFYSHLLENELRRLHEQPEDVRFLLREFESCKAKLGRGSMRIDGNVASADPAPLLPSWQEHRPGIGLHASAHLSQVPYSFDPSPNADEVFPRGKLDQDLQQVDLRATNSWRMRLAEVPSVEMLEVQLVNSVAPFVLCSRLTPLMRRDFTGQKHVVNVTAMEGKFYRFTKPDRHPHTNMAKAALNMLTHTSASELAKDGIYMNAVDTGWVTDEDPAQLSKHKEAVHDFQPPLDIVDGAARICDPFFDGILTGKHWCGKFLKDYFPIDW